MPEENTTQPPFYTLIAAATATGKHKSTLCKAIKSGIISAEKDAFGQYKISPAELHRVYPPISQTPVADASPVGQQEAGNTTLHVSQQETAVLQAQLEATRSLLNRSEEEVRFLREQLAKTTSLLPHLQPQPTAKPKRFLGLFAPKKAAG